MDQVTYFSAPGIKQFVPPSPEASLEWLLDKVVTAYNSIAASEKLVSKAKIIGNSRKDHYVFVRHFFCYLYYAKYPKCTFQLLGDYLSKRDHTTIMHSLSVIQGYIDIKDEQTLTLFTLLNQDPYAFRYTKQNLRSSRKQRSDL